MKKFFILVIILILMTVGNIWSQEKGSIIIKIGKITNLPYKADFVSGISTDFSLAPSAKFLKNLRGDINILIGNPKWQFWQEIIWAKSNQFLIDFGLSYQFSFKVKKIKVQPLIEAGLGYFYASLDWTSIYGYYYSLERQTSFISYYGTGVKIPLSKTKNTFVKPEIRSYQTNNRKMDAFLIGIGIGVSLKK